MATKWADYLITAVRFNASGTHIDKVQIRPDEGDTAGASKDSSRAQVVAWIEAGYTFCTATRSDNKWKKGAPVKIVLIHREKFIKTKADGVKEDNLDNLPTF